MTINLDTLRTAVENAGEAWADGEHIDIITPSVVLALLSRLEQAEQAVQRVRALCVTTDGDPIDPDFDGNTVGDIRHALDGDTRRLADDALGGDQDG